MFPDLTPGPGRLLVLVAHPDDETFGCGSLLLRAAAEGWTTGVVCATRGEAGEPSPARSSPRVGWVSSATTSCAPRPGCSG